MTRTSVQLTVLCGVSVFALIMHRDARADGIEPVAEVGAVAGGTIRSVEGVPKTMGGFSEPGLPKLSLELGIEQQRGSWRIGAAGHLSLSALSELSILARATWWWNRCWSLRLALGPLVTCDRCRGILQDTGIVARAGIGHSSGITLDLEVRALIFDVGRTARPIGTEVTLYGGVTFTGLGRQRSARKGLAFEAGAGLGVSRRDGASFSSHAVVGLGLGRWLTPSLALTARVAGSPDALFDDDAILTVKLVLIAPSLQYRLNDQLWLGGGIGIARALLGFGEGPRHELGLGINLRAGYGIKITADNTINVSLELTRMIMDRANVDLGAILVGYQY